MRDEQFAERRQKALGEWSEPSAAALLEQLRADLTFQIVHGGRNSGLRAKRPRGGRTKTARVGGDHELADLLNS